MISHSIQRQVANLVGPANLLRRLSATTAAGPFRPIYAIHNATSSPTRRGLANTTSSTSAQQSAAPLSKRPVSSVFEDTSDQLPSLPVPNLSETLELLKATIWPMAMNSDEFAQALHLIEAFSGSAGQKLDLLLRAKASQTKNWLSHDWWLEETYLKSRKSLVINSNPALVYPKLPYEICDQRQLIATCAQLVSSIIHCKLALQRGWNPEQVGVPGRQEHQQLDSSLCYDQYRRIFGSTRLPGPQVDTFKPFEPREDEHNFNLICSFKGQFYEIQFEDVSSEQGRLEALESVLSKIISGTDSNSSMPGPGILTTLPRELWAHAIKLIDPNSLEAIERAHLVLNLDTIPSEPEDSYASALVKGEQSNSNSDEFTGALARQILHGDRVNVGNRWFDKSLQLIVVADESCSRLLGAGLNYEHCIGEAVVLTRLIECSHNKVLEYHQRQSKATISGGSSAPETVATFRQLKMRNQDNVELDEHIQRARQDFVSQIDQFDLNYFRYRHYGREAVKAWHYSPDSWFQVALQLAHYQLHRRLAPCYESASTRRFAYGRTETIRSLTKDVGQFCLEPSGENLRAAIESHKGYAQAANAGSAIDRVLLGYRMVFNELKANTWAWGLPTFASGRQLKFNSLADTQREQQLDLNDLFTEKELNTLGAFFNNQLFERAKRFGLSTSQVSSLEHPDIFTCYGPIVPDGYACCYNLSGRQFVAAITANSSNQSFSCETGRFCASLSDSLDRMRNIVEESQRDHHHQRQRHQ